MKALFKTKQSVYDIILDKNRIMKLRQMGFEFQPVKDTTRWIEKTIKPVYINIDSPFLLVEIVRTNLGNSVDISIDKNINIGEVVLTVNDEEMYRDYDALSSLVVKE